jgi:PAS domain S-box-containing protein
MKNRIVISLFALFLFFTVGTGLAVLYLFSNETELQNIIKLHEVEELRRSLVIKIQNVQSDLYTVNTPLARELDFIVNEAMGLEETAHECTTCHHPPKLTLKISKVPLLAHEFQTALSYYITASANRSRIMQLKAEAASIGKRLISLTEEMSHSASINLRERTNLNMKRMNNVRIILYITLTITFLLGTIVAVKLARSITKPVQELVQATRLISSGKLGTTISYKDRTEFGELADHFNSMSRAIKAGYDKTQSEIKKRIDTEDALRKSEEKLQSVFNQMQDMFFRTDQQGRIIWVSPSAAQMLRYKSTTDLVNRTFAEFFAYPENRSSFFENMSSRGMLTNYEAEFLRGDKSSVLVSINAHHYRGNDLEIEGIQGVCRDITERKKLEVEQVKVEKLESVGILAGGIAHDFNNILASILGNVKLAKISMSSQEQIQEILAEAEEACHRATDLTNRLLTFAKGGTPVKKTLRLSKQLKDSAVFAISRFNVQCEFEIQDDLWPVEADEGQINQVVYNMVINASQAMPRSGTVRISAENIINDSAQFSLPLQNRDYIRITIRDEGIGIPKEYINKIFDPYFSTKQRGIGLGLASSYSIIKGHSGYVDVKSETGKGTAFFIYLPATREVTQVKKLRLPVITEGDEKILIMDDDDNIRKTFNKTLTRLGYNVSLAREGGEAIEMYTDAKNNGDPFNVVVLDLTIRDGLGGKETIEKLLEVDPDVKAVVSSGYSNDPMMSDYLKYGFKGVLVKPYEIERLTELIQILAREPV